MKKNLSTFRQAGVACLTLVLAAGCGGSGGSGGSGTGGTDTADQGQGSPTTISAALTGFPATAATKGYLVFGDLAQLASLNGGAAATGQFSDLVGTGADSIAPFESTFPGQTGIDPDAATAGVELGNPPDQAGVLYGTFDPTTIGKKLQGLGYTQHTGADGATRWILKDDDQIDPAGGLGENGPLALFNVVDVSATRIVYGGSSATVGSVADPGTNPLSADPTTAGLASCLGQAKAAMIAPTSEGSTPVGIGVLATSAQDVTEETCVPTSSAVAASALAAGWATRIGTGISVKSDEPWSALFADPQSTVIGGPANVVRLTVHPGPSGKPGSLFQAFMADDLSALIGP